MDLPGKGLATNSKLNAGNDGSFVQAVLSNNAASLSPTDLPYCIEVAKKLMTIYCAGTCAEIYFENNLRIPDELEMDISGQDLTIMEKIQSFLKNAAENHPDDFPSQTIVSVFKKLKDPATWKAIEMLGEKVSLQEQLKRFFIEDTLMMAGIKIQKVATRSGFSLGVHEDEEIKPAMQETATFQQADISPLDIVVKDFLKKIKTNWTEVELTDATNYLHNVYKKYS